MLTFNRLRQVLALAEHGHFGRAAATLGISQPALSKSIQTLESALGARLFDRQPNSVTLTVFGELVAGHALHFLLGEKELHRDIQLLAGREAGHLDVMLGPYPSVISGYRACGAVMARHPGLRIALHVANWRVVTSAVAEKKAEIGVAELSDALLNENLQTEEVGHLVGRVFCRRGHPILRAERVTMKTLLDYPWAFTRIPPRLAINFPRSPVRAGHLDEVSGDFVPAIELDVPMQLPALLTNTEILALGTFSMFEQELLRGDLVHLPTPWNELRAHYGFIYRRSRSLSPAALAYMQAVRDEEALYRDREEQLERRFGLMGAPVSGGAAPLPKTKL